MFKYRIILYKYILHMKNTILCMIPTTCIIRFSNLHSHWVVLPILCSYWIDHSSFYKGVIFMNHKLAC